MITNIKVKYIVGYVHNTYLIGEYIKFDGIEIETQMWVHI